MWCHGYTFLSVLSCTERCRKHITLSPFPFPPWQSKNKGMWAENSSHHTNILFCFLILLLINEEYIQQSPKIEILWSVVAALGTEEKYVHITFASPFKKLPSSTKENIKNVKDLLVLSCFSSWMSLCRQGCKLKVQIMAWHLRKQIRACLLSSRHEMLRTNRMHILAAKGLTIKWTQVQHERYTPAFVCVFDTPTPTHTGMHASAHRGL